MEIYSNKWIFQNDITAPADGLEFVCGRNDQITLYISGDSTSRTVHFEGKDDEGNWYEAPAVKLPELTIATSTTGNDESWVLNTTNWISVKARVSAVAGGTVRITGKIVESNINLMNAVSAKINESVLPDGAATETTLSAISSYVDNIETILTSNATEAEMLTIDNTVGGISLTSAKYGTCTKATIQVQDASIRYWTTSSAPTSSDGILAQIGAIIYLDTTDDIANFKAIRATSTNANLACQYSN